MIYSKPGNGDIWIAGYGGDVPDVGVGIPLLEGHPITLPCNNLNQISLIPEVDGNEVYITAGGSGRDVAITPSNAPSLDLTLPTVTTTAPTAGAVSQETNVLIIITLSEEIDPTTVTNTSVSISPAVAGATATLDSSDPTKINLVHSTNLALSTTYTVTLSTAISDLAGNHLAAPFSYSFTTKAAPPPPDTTRPTIVSHTPANFSAVDISVVPTVTFSEAMLLSSFNSGNTFVDVDSNGQSVSASYSLSADLKTVSLTNMTLAGSTIYDMFVNSGGPRDLAGNTVSNSLFIQFVTNSTSSSSTIYNVTGDTWDPIYNGGNTAIKETVGSSSSAIFDWAPVKYVFRLKKVGSPSGSVSIKIIHNNGSVFTTKRSVGTISTASIGTSETSITVNDAGNTYYLAVNDQITVEYTGGNSSNYIQVKTAISDAFDGTRTFKSKTNANGNNADYTSSDLAMTMDAI